LKIFDLCLLQFYSSWFLTQCRHIVGTQQINCRIFISKKSEGPKICYLWSACHVKIINILWNINNFRDFTEENESSASLKIRRHAHTEQSVEMEWGLLLWSKMFTLRFDPICRFAIGSCCPIPSPLCPFVKLISSLYILFCNPDPIRVLLDVWLSLPAHPCHHGFPSTNFWCSIPLLHSLFIPKGRRR
jgi:hypothetical protein